MQDINYVVWVAHPLFSLAGRLGCRPRFDTLLFAGTLPTSNDPLLPHLPIGTEMIPVVSPQATRRAR